MPKVVPYLEFLHEAETEIEPPAPGPLDPAAYWSGLSPRVRARIAAKLGAPGAIAAEALRSRGERPRTFVMLRGRGFVETTLSSLHRALMKPVATIDPAPAESLFVPGMAKRRPFVEVLAEASRLPVPAGIGPPDPEPGDGSVDRYDVEPPFARVSVARLREGGRLYRVEEPHLTAFEQALLAGVDERLREAVALGETGNDAHAEAFVARLAMDLLKSREPPLSPETLYKVGYYVLRNYSGSGRLHLLLRDQLLEDVSCNGPGMPLYTVHSRHGSLPTNVVFDEAELNAFTVKLAQRGGKLLSVSQPLVDATLPDGSRIQASLGREVTSRGSAFTIRRFREDPLTAVDLIRGGTQTPETLALLWLAVEAKRSLIVMGATASGKTTTLSCLSQFIPPTQKVVSIEDTREISLQHENWLAAVTREAFAGREEGTIGMFDLLRAALRQRPDYLIVGEIRGVEGLTLFQAMSTGHTCFSTMHAGNVPNAVYRLENPPIGVPRVMLTALDFFLVQAQVDVGGKAARRMVSLTELNGIDPVSRNLRTNEIFRWDGARDEYVAANPSASIENLRQRRGWSRGRLDEELAERRRVLEKLVAQGRRSNREVAGAVHNFYRRNSDGTSITVPVRQGGAVATPKEIL